MQIFTALPLANCPGRDQEAFSQFATVTLKLSQGQKFCSQTVAQGKIFGYAKFCLATLKTLPLRSIRV